MVRSMWKVNPNGTKHCLLESAQIVPGHVARLLAQLLGRSHKNVVVVALANKLVRMAWAVLCKNERYRAPVLAVTT